MLSVVGIINNGLEQSSPFCFYERVRLGYNNPRVKTVNFDSLKRIQLVLLLNWIVAPALGVLVWVERSLLSAIGFLVVWLIADGTWDWVTDRLILRSFAFGSSEEQLFGSNMRREISLLSATTMLADTLGTLALPWVAAGFFLEWFF